MVVFLLILFYIFASRVSVLNMDVLFGVDFGSTVVLLKTILQLLHLRDVPVYPWPLREILAWGTIDSGLP